MLFQALAEEGLGRYVDPLCLQREIADATGMTNEEINKAAREVLHQPNNRPPYYDHLGGYGLHEMKDYNQYSQQDDLLKPKPGYSSDYPEDSDEMVYVTTL